MKPREQAYILVLDILIAVEEARPSDHASWREHEVRRLAEPIAGELERLQGQVEALEREIGVLVQRARSAVASAFDRCARQAERDGAGHVVTNIRRIAEAALAKG